MRSSRTLQAAGELPLNRPMRSQSEPLRFDAAFRIVAGVEKRGNSEPVGMSVR